MKGDPRLSVLIVRHADNQGAFQYTIDLSRRRADAVVKMVVGRYRIKGNRLRGAGVDMMAPAAMKR